MNTDHEKLWYELIGIVRANLKLSPQSITKLLSDKYVAFPRYQFELWQ